MQEQRAYRDSVCVKSERERQENDEEQEQRDGKKPASPLFQFNFTRKGTASSSHSLYHHYPFSLSLLVASLSRSSQERLKETCVPIENDDADAGFNS